MAFTDWQPNPIVVCSKLTSLILKTTCKFELEWYFQKKFLNKENLLFCAFPDKRSWVHLKFKTKIALLPTMKGIFYFLFFNDCRNIQRMIWSPIHWHESPLRFLDLMVKFWYVNRIQNGRVPSYSSNSYLAVMWQFTQ